MTRWIGRVRFAALPFLGIPALVLGVSAWAESAKQVPTFCLWHIATGLPCPSCGMTRAFVALGHADWGAAILLNPASPAVFLAAWLLLGLALIQVLSGRETLLRTWTALRGKALPVAAAGMGTAWAANLASFWIG